MGNYEKVFVGNIIPNDWNMNEVKDVNMSKLKEDIQRTGDNSDQPILVRNHPSQEGKFQIIDGEHRWRACQELGIQDVWVKVKDMEDKEAIIKTISMNKFRGDFDTIRLAETLHMLNTVHNVSFQELEELLGYTESELINFEEILGFDFSQYDTPLPPEEKTKEENLFVEFNLTCTEEQRLSYLEAIEKCKKETGEEGDAELLSLICKKYITE